MRLAARALRPPAFRGELIPSSRRSAAQPRCAHAAMASAAGEEPAAIAFGSRTRREVENRGASQVWNEVLALARQPGVLDLGQGWPDFGASSVARATAADAITRDDDGGRLNQYTTANGLPALNAALAEYYAALHGWRLDPGTEVLVTTSATEGLYACLQAFLDPGDEVICFEPVFPWYVSHVRLAGATTVPVRLQAPGFALDVAALAAAFTPRTKALIYNSPHNPTGHVATAAECAAIAALCVRHNVLALADEVYERKTFGNRPEVRLADFPGMRQRTLTIGTASKLFSLTGWRVGWVLGPAALLAGVRTVHSYSTFCAPTPLQAGVAEALRAAAAQHCDATAATPGAPPGPDESAVAFERNAEVLGAALSDVGLDVIPAEGGYFLVADVAATGLDAGDYCKQLIANARVAAVPMDVFYFADDAPRTLVRFALCKRPETIAAAAAAIRAAPVPLRR